MFTDTHCHLYDEYYESLGEIINDSINKGVHSFINAGCDGLSNKEVIEKVSKYKFMYGVIGIHPEYVLTYTLEDILDIERHLKDEKIVGIGEIGLDYHYDALNKDAQKELFIKQLELAKKYDLPVVIHSRDATEDTINILKRYPTVKGVIHSFSGSIETARIYKKMGYKLGINGVVTFKNSHLKDILEEMLDIIVLETDAPYLTPHPYRGTKNSPSYIPLIATFISDYTGIDINTLSSLTEKNVRDVYKKIK